MRRRSSGRLNQVSSFAANVVPAAAAWTTIELCRETVLTRLSDMPSAGTVVGFYLA